MSEVKINQSQGLFVIPLNGGGFSTRGFDSLYYETLELAKRLGSAVSVRENEKGTIKQFQQNRELIGSAKSRGGFEETWFDPRTPQGVQQALESARKGQRAIRVFYGDVVTGESWLEENDVVGYVGRSSGIMKIPLMLVGARSDGGGALLDHCIVRVVEANSRKELYRHPRFHLPKMEITNDLDYAEGYPFQVRAKGQVHAAFKSHIKAQYWIAFMHGNRMTVS